MAVVPQLQNLGLLFKCSIERVGTISLRTVLSWKPAVDPRKIEGIMSISVLYFSIAEYPLILVLFLIVSC